MSNTIVTSLNSVNIIENSEQLGVNLPVDVFPNKKLTTDHQNIFIFDLINNDQPLPSNLLNNHNKNIGDNIYPYSFQIFYLDNLNTLDNIKDLTFQDIIKITMSNNNTGSINDLFDNLKKISKYVFYDGISTLNSCQISTFWLILKFFQFMKENVGNTLQIMLYESNQCQINNAKTFNSVSTILPSRKPTQKMPKKRQFNLSLKLPVSTKKHADLFIDSLKEDLIQYSPTSLLKHFHIKSLDSLYNNDNHISKDILDMFPTWLEKIIDTNDEKTILSSLWTKFNILEHLEHMRLKSCLINNTEYSSQNENLCTTPPLLNTKSLQFKGQHINIYSLSLLQKQFKRQKTFEHKFKELSVTIPQNSLNTILNGNNNDTTPLSTCSTDSDILPTPLNNYKIDKGIQQFEKNRYSNNLPYEHSIVKLNNSNDYFNANFIKFPQINNNFHYIATQAPLPNTINDFWDMIWNEKIKVIISLNSNEELKLKKWDIYWGESLDTNAKLNVQLIDQWDNLCGIDGIILRQFHSTRSDPLNNIIGKHIVYQLQYTNWSDSCAINIKDILSIYKIRTLLTYDDTKFLALLKSHKNIRFDIPSFSVSETDLKKHRNTPLLVHCSAGCGRTGVYITLDYILCLFRNELKEKNKINVWNMEDDLLFIIVNELRKQRKSMVQNLNQYIACYDEMIQYFLSYQ